jgi:ribosomal protein L31E
MAKDKRQEVCTREYTINLGKRLHDITFKKRAPRAVKEIKKFAAKQMGTKEVRVDVKLNKAVWSQVGAGVRWAGVRAALGGGGLQEQLGMWLELLGWAGGMPCNTGSVCATAAPGNGIQRAPPAAGPTCDVRGSSNLVPSLLWLLFLCCRA